MKKIIALLSLLSFCACSNPSTAMAEDNQAADAEKPYSEEIDQGQEVVVTYETPNGLSETCKILEKFPNISNNGHNYGDYSKTDKKQEAKLCGIDFYDSKKTALCAKTWSTSPGTVVIKLKKSKNPATGLPYTAAEYEKSKYCGQKTKGPGAKTAAKFKTTMNQNDTSGTFSQSSLLYYHFSRLLDTKLNVPVAVYREMDRKVMSDRVANAKSGLRANSGRIGAGWKWMRKASANPSSYKPTHHIVTPDKSKFYGILIRGKGTRYGKVVNGLRGSWGTGDAKAFKQTPAFYALRSPEALPQAIQEGIKKAKSHSAMKPHVDKNISELQMLMWMRELTELTLLDYIFSQQDRVGNIDYDWYWFYVKDGKVKKMKEDREDSDGKSYNDYTRSKFASIPVPAEIADMNPILIQRTNINDNDAGGLVRYANWAKESKADWLSDQKHYSKKIFENLMALHKSLQDEDGPLRQWLKRSPILDAGEIRQVVRNTALAVDNILGRCEKMTYDLDDVDSFQLEGYRTEEVDCDYYRHEYFNN